MTAPIDPNPRASDLRPNDRFEVLLGQLVDGEMSPARYEELAALLRESPERRRQYVQWMSLHVRLLSRSEVVSLGAAGEMRPALIASATADADAPLETTRKPDSPAAARPRPATPVLGFLGGVIDYVSHSRTLLFCFICGCLGLYFTIQLGSLVMGRFWAQNAAQVADDRGAETEKSGQLANQAVAPAGKVVARLTNAVDCQWKVAAVGRSDLQPSAFSLQPFDVGTEFHAGQKLNLAAGLAELTFDSGAKVILHAPARFDVTDALGGDLQRGKLTAKVPHTAVGFTVATPGGKVVDLGTEFGVKVNDDGVMNVIVYVGEVKVESSSGGTGAGGTDQPGMVHVKAGQAVTVGADHVVKPIPPENERFVRDLAPLGDRTKAEAAYVEFMKSLKPTVWFRMEGKDTDRVIHDEMGAIPDGELRWDGPGNPFVKGLIGKGLWLRGAKLADHAYVADYPKAEHGKLTVSAWAYAETRHTDSTIAANWRENAAAGQFQFGLFSGVNRENANLGVGITANDGRGVGLAEGEKHPFPLYEWQHVAFSTDGATLRLYRQGREVATLKHAGLRYPSPIRSLGIGVTFDPTDKQPSKTPSCWDGKLDEIAIFNDTLSPDDIRRLAAFGPR